MCGPTKPGTASYWWRNFVPKVSSALYLFSSTHPGKCLNGSRRILVHYHALFHQGARKLREMTQSAVVHNQERDSARAGASLGKQILEALEGQPPDALILFASPIYEHEVLLGELSNACRPKVLIGCSSAGEFVRDQMSDSSACAVALKSSDLHFSAGLGRHLQGDRVAAAKAMGSAFQGMRQTLYPFRSALVLTDALARYSEELMEQLTIVTGGAYQLFGGGAGDDARFRSTHVFFGTETFTDSAVALEILSHTPLGIGVCHGWQPATPAMRVTEAEGMRLISLNALPVVEVFAEHASQTDQVFMPSDPIPFFLHNVIGIETTGGYKLRVPLALNVDGSITCAAEVPSGSTVRIMSATTASASEAAATAARSALSQLKGRSAAVAFFFDCAATKLRAGREFGLELEQVTAVLGNVPYAGCNTYGQIARVEGQLSGFHNCTAVVCAIPA